MFEAVVEYAIYTLVSFLGIIIIGLLVYLLYNWVVYGEIGHSMSVLLDDDELYINGKKVTTVSGSDSSSISTVNGSVFVDGKLIYKHKKKFRWSKSKPS
jgi:hypothetical protein